MSDNNGRATIREVYAIVYRIEDKLDKKISNMDVRIDSIDSRLSNFEGKVTILGSITGFLAGIIGSIVKGKF